MSRKSKSRLPRPASQISTITPDDKISIAAEAGRASWDEGNNAPFTNTSMLPNPLITARPQTPDHRDDPPELQGVPRVLSEATVVAIAITRDDARFLPKALQMMRGCLAVFKAYDVIIVENDSTDETQEILSNWTRDDPRIIVDSRNLSRGSGKLVDKKKSIGLMAALRNRALELAFLLSYSSSIRHAWSADLVVVLDLDIQAIDVAGFANAAFAVLTPGGVAGATPNGVFQDGRYYDVYAFRSCNLHWNPRNGPLMRRMPTEAFKTLMPLYTKDLAPFPVDSAFSGAAIYRADLVFGPRIWLGQGGGAHDGGPAFPDDGQDGSLADDARARMPQWRGHELAGLLSQRPTNKDASGDKYRHPTQKDGATTGNPASPLYFAAAAVEAGREPFLAMKNAMGEVSTQKSGVTRRSHGAGTEVSSDKPITVLPCVYSDAAARECEHVPFSACINARAAAQNIPPIHLVPTWGLLYSEGQSPQLKKAKETPVPVLLGPQNETLFSLYSVAQPLSTSMEEAHKTPEFWKGPGSVRCDCSLWELC